MKVSLKKIQEYCASFTGSCNGCLFKTEWDCVFSDNYPCHYPIESIEKQYKKMIDKQDEAHREKYRLATGSHSAIEDKTVSD